MLYQELLQLFNSTLNNVELKADFLHVELKVYNFGGLVMNCHPLLLIHVVGDKAG